MEMLHKHPESGDILNLQDAKFFLGRKKTPKPNYYIQSTVSLDETFRYGKSKANCLMKKVFKSFL